MRAHATHEKWGALGLKQVNEGEFYTVNCKEGGPHRPSYAEKSYARGNCKVAQWREKEGGLPVLCASWQDNNVVNFMTTLHNEEDFHAYEEKDRKRRKATIRIYDPTLERDQPLRIPIPYWQYNHYMGSTDQHSQLKASYTTSHPMRRVWWPLFFDLLDSAVGNAYVVHRAMIERLISYRETLLTINIKLREKGYREFFITRISRVSRGLQRIKLFTAVLTGLRQGIQH